MLISGESDFLANATIFNFLVFLSEISHCPDFQIPYDDLVREHRAMMDQSSKISRPNPVDIPVDSSMERTASMRNQIINVAKTLKAAVEINVDDMEQRFKMFDKNDAFFRKQR